MDLSIVLPSHNEERSLRNKVEEVLEEFKNLEVEIIIVEDGCTDATPEIADKLSKEYSQVKHLHSNKRLGKGKAIEKGLNHSNSDVKGFMDADRSIHPFEVRKLYQKLLENKKDIVIASRYLPESNIKRKKLRQLKAKTYNVLTRKTIRTGFKDHQCGLKLFTSSAWNKLNGRVGEDGWFWDTKMLYEAEKLSLETEEIGIDWIYDKESSFKFLDSVVMFEKLLDLGTKERNLPVDMKFFRFAFVGALGAGLNTVILYLLTELGDIYYIYSALIAIEAAVIFMFFLNNHITFKKMTKLSEILKGLLKSNIIRSTGILTQIGLLYILTEFLGIFYVLSNLIAIVVASVVNFVGERDYNWN